jgi:hypothetical protein
MHHNLTTSSSSPRAEEPFRRGVLQGCLQQLSKNYWILQVVVPPVIALLQVAADGLTSNTNKNSDQAGQGKSRPVLLILPHLYPVSRD